MGVGNAQTLIDNVFRKGQKLFRIKLVRDENFIPDFKYLKKIYNIININIEKGNIQAATVVESDTMTAIIKSLLGEGAGMSFAKVDKEMFMPAYGDFIVAVKDISQLHIEETEYLGIVDDLGQIRGSDFEISFDELKQAYCKTLNGVFPFTAKAEGEARAFNYTVKNTYKCKTKVAKPAVFIPVFPGTNCEDDAAEIPPSGQILRLW